ncbi:YczE/YyaS/YitT family protein [Anaerosalibacter sp. Marseille-P3206]|uniref:YczE/YyaS/YitT family protein n=1 Tax=Anaerosalibacter sp. Marseille-P3206 TaxID=1871005 RepID=UPI00098689F3|nr:hypothetical protein [Anaerosalibacter sp. Marseille-P3206]
MKKTVLTYVRLFIGLFICAVGMVMTINANLGLSPWDVFHQGIANIFNITIGKANILVGVFIVILDIIIGEKIGWGTLCNMIFIGLFIDLLMLNNIIPTFNGTLQSLIMMLIGLFILGFGCYLYIGAGLGAGPRDSLMVALTKKTHKSVRLIKSSIELGALIIGYILGGKVGVGTVIMAVGGGYFTQLAFRIMKFDVSKVEQRLISDDINFIKDKLLAAK